MSPLPGLNQAFVSASPDSASSVLLSPSIVVQAPSDTSFGSVDLNALAAFSRLIKTETLRMLVVLNLRLQDAEGTLREIGFKIKCVQEADLCTVRHSISPTATVTF